MRRAALLAIVVALSCGEQRVPPPPILLRPDGGAVTSDGGGGRFDAGAQTDFILVQTVLDGDTVILSAGAAVRTPDDQPMIGQHVRLLGVDAPEIAHPEKNPPEAVECWGDESHAAARTLAQGRAVEVTYDLSCAVPIAAADAERCGLRDMYGRLLAYVRIIEGGVVLNENQIRRGNACSYRRFAHRDRTRYNDLEAQAQAEHLGLWAACPPRCQ